MKIEPQAYDRCIHCGKPLGAGEYYYTKRRGRPPRFIHKRCYNKLIPKHKKEELPKCEPIEK